MLSKIIYTSIFFILFSSLAHSKEDHVDPFSLIEHIQYENGLHVYLAPSKKSNNTAVRLEVKVGWEVEDSKNWGVSHLLEHVLFRDKQLKDEMTYLQLIREAGGEANGGTGERITNYFGNIPYQKGTWLLENFTKMILEPTFSDEYVEKEKDTVELEIGRPGPISVFLGYNPVDYFSPSYLEMKDFWQSEFGLSKIKTFTDTEEQLSNRRLTTAQVKKHYEDYYVPRNMRLFISGNFDRSSVLKVIESKWKSLPSAQGLSMSPVPEPHPKLSPYRRTILTTSTPYIYLGTKVWDASVLDVEVIRSYTEYLSHRLMKEIRNLKGQMYTAHSETYISHGYGYSYIGFQTQDAHMAENIRIAQDYLGIDMHSGALTDEQVKEAIDLYMSGYFRMENEAQDMMQIARTYEEIVSYLGHFESPYQKLKEVSVDEYKAILKKHFEASKKYEFVYAPYYFFHYDIYLIYFLIAIGTFLFLKKVLTKKFEHNKLKWVRKIQFPPLMTLEALALLGGWFVFIHVQYLINQVFIINAFQSHVLIAEYIRSAIWAFSLLAVAQAVVSLLPRKLMIMNDKLVIKSTSYYSKHILLEDIDSVEKLSVFSFRLSELALFKGLSFRNYYFNPLIWQPGVLFHLKNGKSYFFSFSDADSVIAEFNSIKTSSKSCPDKDAA